MSEGMKISKGKNFTDEKPVVVIKGAYFYYLQHAPGGVMKYGKEGNSPLDKEYPVQVLVTEKIAKTIKKIHKKLSVKEYTAKEFEENFKVAPPFTSEDDEYFTIRVSNNAAYKDKKTGEVKEFTPLNVQDKIRNSLSDTLVGNGSMGIISLNMSNYDHPKFGKGTSINIGRIVIQDLVEYVSNSSDIDDDDDFDYEEDDLDSAMGEEDDFEQEDTPVVSEESDEEEDEDEDELL